MPDDDPFDFLIRTYAASRGLTVSALCKEDRGREGGRSLAQGCVIPAPWRPVLLRRGRGGEEVVFSSAISLAQDEVWLLAEDVAAYNAWRLFEGGHRLRADAATRSLYLSQTRALAETVRSGLAAVLEDFVEACRLCSLWYGARLHRAAPDAACAEGRGP